MTKKEIDKVKRFLPAGEQEKIAIETGFSYSYVNKVLNRKRKNLKILATAKRIAKTYETEITGRSN
ncbi:MAG: hypothetical protein M0Q94_14800 [Candidatus Cloacimonetes bacterium]|jgi:glutamyl-tRNA reductase|nr:hypothetical protein [Candidatus Cloacimonadota bacterium]